MDDEPSYRLSRRAEEHARRQFARPVLSSEIQSEPRLRRELAAAAAVNAHADARRKKQLAAVEVRHAAFAFPFLAMFQLVRKDAPGWIVEIRVRQR